MFTNRNTLNFFADLDFDVYTSSLFYRIFIKAANDNNHAFCEEQSITCKSLSISRNILKAALGLLQYSNIIKLEQRKDTKKPAIFISSKITVIHPDLWDLSHDVRTIKQYKEMKKEINKNNF